VVELYALRGAEGWWGSQLAWIRNSLIIYVTYNAEREVYGRVSELTGEREKVEFNDFPESSTLD
jgi:hypothetical protein